MPLEHGLRQAGQQKDVPNSAQTRDPSPGRQEAAPYVALPPRAPPKTLPEAAPHTHTASVHATRPRAVVRHDRTPPPRRCRMPLVPGQAVEALWPEDGEWYNAVVRAVTNKGIELDYEDGDCEDHVSPQWVRSIDEPIPALVENSPRMMDKRGRTWERVISVTGQPNRPVERDDVPEENAIQPATVF